jgi:hypothetical protein
MRPATDFLREAFFLLPEELLDDFFALFFFAICFTPVKRMQRQPTVKLHAHRPVAATVGGYLQAIVVPSGNAYADAILRFAGALCG